MPPRDGLRPRDGASPAAWAARALYGLAWRLAGPLVARRAVGRLEAAGVPAPRARERAGWPTIPRPEGRLIWIHAASVGESLSVLPLVERMAAPGRTVLVTTGTAASAAILAPRLPPHAIHQFAPLDAPGMVGRCLRHWSPDLLVTVESEVWPTLLRAARRRGVPLVLVNARLGARSLRTWERSGPIGRSLFSLFDRVVAQTPATALALSGMGARGVTVGGNMKAAAGAPPHDAAELERLRAALGERARWAAASTHPGEEEAALDAHLRVRARAPGALLVLVPRHPERAGEVAALAAARGLTVARRSRGEAPDADVLLADTLGEMGLWVRLAPVVFLGGSLVPVGGHNPWEPAAAGAAILHGPHVESAAADHALLDAAGGAAEVSDAGALADRVASLLSDPAAAAAMGARARAVAEAQGVAVDAIAADLLALVPDRPAPPAWIAPSAVDVIAPNLKRRYSGVTSTVLRLVPIQAQAVRIAAAGPVLPPALPRIRLRDLVAMPREGPSGPRVWHARRNVEMLAGLVLGRVLRKRLRLLFTSAAQRRHSRYTRGLIGRMDAVVATSSRSAAFLTVPHRTILHGVDADLFRPPEDRAALRRSLGLDPGAVLVGAFGRLRAQKGTDLIVDALLAALPDHPQAQAILMGGVTADQRAFVDGLRARIAAAGLGDRLRILPEDGGTDIARWYGALDLYVTAPRNEGFGLTPLEAMACGVPVLTSDAGAFRDIVADGVTGRIVPAGDGAALAAALRDLLGDPAARARMAAAARPHVLARHRIADEAAALNALYAALLREG